MQTHERPVREGKELARDFALGLLGGLAGTLAMTKAMPLLTKLEREEAQRLQNEAAPESSVYVLARRLTGLLGLEVSEENLGRLAEAIHWVYGTSWGGVLGLLHDRTPRLMRAGALPFGLLFYLLSDEAMPAALKLAPPPNRLPVDMHLRDLVGHLVWTFTADAVYHGARRVAS